MKVLCLLLLLTVMTVGCGRTGRPADPAIADHSHDQLVQEVRQIRETPKRLESVLVDSFIMTDLSELQNIKVNAAKTSVESLRLAVTWYQMSNDRLPESLQILTQPDPCYFNEVYIEEDVMR